MKTQPTERNGEATYRISLDGCDDSTSVEMELTPAELATLFRVAEELNAESSYGCQPVMRIRLATDDNDDEEE